MEVSQISQLAEVLRDNGDEILSSKSKFSLSINLLHILSDYFVQVIERDANNASFQVISNSSTRNDTLRDLHFLHDFIQRTVSLKLTRSLIQQVAPTDVVDISKFKNVRLLELSRVSPMCIQGIQAVKTQLQFLVCVRSVGCLSEILEKCGADESPGFTWCNLKEASFTYNSLEVIDTSLEFVPWLHTLDLSHNKIEDARPVNCLSNLKNLNLSYNCLKCVPQFTGQICNRLQVLKLNNNFLEDIKELTALINLCELDLSNNCLLDQEFLGALTYLAALQWLNLEGNPLSFHPQHRSRTARYLHSNTSTVRFLLDRVMLTSAEKKLVGSLHLVHSALHRPHYTSFSSDVSETTGLTSDRQRRVRNAVINEDDELCDMEASIASVASLLVSSDHLETKQKIEQIRRDHGEKWLHSMGGGSFVQDILGLERSGVVPSSSPYERDFLIHAQDVDFGANDQTNSGQSTFVTANESAVSESNSIYPAERTLSPEPEAPISDDENLGEGEESLFLANIKGDSEPIFVVVTETHIWERESDAKEKTRWPIELLQSCELLGDDCTKIRLTFDTLRRDRREREYVLEVNEATRLSCVLNNILTNRPPEKNNLIVYKCMKCSTQFSEERKSGLDTPVLECPICQSTVVIEDDENVTPK